MTIQALTIGGKPLLYKDVMCLGCNTKTTFVLVKIVESVLSKKEDILTMKKDWVFACIHCGIEKIMVSKQYIVLKHEFIREGIE